MLRSILGEAGFASEGAHDGHAALTRIRARPPQLVLLDLGLPRLSGWDLCQTLLDDPALRDIPVVILTARGSREDFDRGRRFANVHGYFVKPYATADVVRHVARLFAARP